MEINWTNVSTLDAAAVQYFKVISLLLLLLKLYNNYNMI